MCWIKIENNLAIKKAKGRELVNLARLSTTSPPQALIVSLQSARLAHEQRRRKLRFTIEPGPILSERAE